MIPSLDLPFFREQLGGFTPKALSTGLLIVRRLVKLSPSCEGSATSFLFFLRPIKTFQRKVSEVRKMTSKKTEESSKIRPIKKARSGRFQISLWNFRQHESKGSKESITYLEQDVERGRTCIQFSTYSKATNKWQNQSIWCSPQDLRSLADAMDKYDEEVISSSSS